MGSDGFRASGLRFRFRVQMGLGLSPKTPGTHTSRACGLLLPAVRVARPECHILPGSWKATKQSLGFLGL